jgi:hypothetical protein
LSSSIGIKIKEAVEDELIIKKLKIKNTFLKVLVIKLKVIRNFLNES